MSPDAATVPFDPDAERSVLGACLVDRRAIDVAADSLLPEDFRDDGHRQAWDLMLRLHRAGRPVDAVILADAMIEAGAFDRLGGDGFLTGLVESAADPADVRYFVGIVREQSDLRMRGTS
jgi:replicative DNA helicase